MMAFSQIREHETVTLLLLEFTDASAVSFSEYFGLPKTRKYSRIFTGDYRVGDVEAGKVKDSENLDRRIGIPRPGTFA